MRAVLDSNVLVSAILSSSGPPRRLLDGARAQRFELLSSAVLMTELFDVISRAKFAARLARAGFTPFGIASDIWRLAIIATPLVIPRVIAGDADDDHVLACGAAGDADMIVTGDHDFDHLGGSYQGIQIASPVEAARILLGN